MFKRIWKVVHPLLTLAAVGCCVYLLLRPTAPIPSGRASDSEDRLLRGLLEIKRIGGDAELPSDVPHCALATFLYKDGQLDHRRNAYVFSPNGGSRVIPYLVVWGPTPKGIRGMTVDQAFTMSNADDIWATLDGPLSWCNGPVHAGEVHGFRIIGFAASGECRPGHEAMRNTSCVLMLGYKPFATRQEAEDYAYGDGILQDFRNHKK